MAMSVQETTTVWEALRLLLYRAYEPLEAARVQWVVLGSASVALQGIQVEPRELRILTDPAGIEVWALHVWDWLDERPEEQEPGRLTARLTVEKVRVTLLVREPKPGQEDVLLEGMGGRLWQVVIRSRFQKWLVPVVPLEVHLATAVARMVKDRMDPTWQRLATALAQELRRQGFQRELLEEALSPYGPTVAQEALRLIRTVKN